MKILVSDPLGKAGLAVLKKEKAFEVEEHYGLKPEELKKLLDTYRISVSQLPKIKSTDPCVPEGSQRGEVVKIEREVGGEKRVYHRVIV